MRPSSASSSSSNRNAPCPQSPQFIDFFAREQEQSDLANANLLPTADDGAASASTAVGIQQVQQYLIDQRYALPRGFLTDVAIQNRLHSADLSAETLLSALQILSNPQHPLLVSLGVSDHELKTLRNRIAGIVSNRSGFLTPIRTEVLQSNDNPELLIRNLLSYLRHLAR